IGVLPFKLEDTRLGLAAAIEPRSSLVPRVDSAIKRRHVLRNCRDVLNSTNKIIAFAANEARDCRALAPGIDVAYFPNMVSDEGYRVDDFPTNPEPPYHVALAGHLRGTATQSGLHFFATKVVPALRTQGVLETFHFHIIGKFDPPTWLRELLPLANV